MEQSPDDILSHHAVGYAEPVRDGGSIQALDLIHDE